MRRNLPSRTSASLGLIAAACTRTSTSPGPGTGAGMSRTSSTSGPPKRSWTAAFIESPGPQKNPPDHPAGLIMRFPQSRHRRRVAGPGRRLSRLLQLLLPLAQRGQAVHLGAVQVGGLAGLDILAGPGLLRGGLQGAAVGE